MVHLPWAQDRLNEMLDHLAGQMNFPPEMDKDNQRLNALGALLSYWASYNGMDAWQIMAETCRAMGDDAGAEWVYVNYARPWREGVVASGRPRWGYVRDEDGNWNFQKLDNNEIGTKEEDHA